MVNSSKKTILKTKAKWYQEHLTSMYYEMQSLLAFGHGPNGLSKHHIETYDEFMRIWGRSDDTFKVPKPQELIEHEKCPIFFCADRIKEERRNKNRG